MTDSRQDYDDLAREVMALRWSRNPAEQARREPELARLLAIELSPPARERLALMVKLLRRSWGRHQADDFDGWDEEQEAILTQTDTIADTGNLTEDERHDFDARVRGLDWQIGMWKVLNDDKSLKG